MPQDLKTLLFKTKQPSWMLFVVVGLLSIAFLFSVGLLQNGKVVTQVTVAPKRPVSVTAEKLHNDALRSSLYVNESGDRDLAQGNGFQITYIAPDDRFVIHIWDNKNVEAVRKRAEKYFLRNLLKTNDIDAACELNVIVASTGPTQSLSFCTK